MKAVLCKAFSTPFQLSIEEVPEPTAGPGQVLIAVKAAGINFPDSLIVQGKYQVKPPLPFTPGMEAAGTVLAVGTGVEHLRPGMRVLAHPDLGAFAEKVLAPAHHAYQIPDAMNFNEAAGFVLAYGTSYNALKDRAQLKAGETLLVLGAAGGIGLTAVELGKLTGAKVIAVASSAEKLALCEQYGADELIDYSHEDLRERIKQITDGKGIDVVYDPVGGAYAEPSIRSLARYGRYLVMGFASGEIPKIPLNLMLLKTSSVVGAFWGQFVANEPQRNAENMRELFALYNAGKLHPHISATFPFEQVAAAIEHVAGRKVLGKAVLTFD
ncbi:MAG TPA: NADPH:quinone oxidoreductase family protein [Spongiibacteraceae bacterium]|jgi:NADPH2:quinone reductase